MAILITVILGGVALLSLHITNKPQIYSTWIWDTREFQENSQEYFNFLEKKGFSKLYVQIDRELPKDQYETMINEATSKNIIVVASDGAKDWVYSQDEVEALLSWLDEYQTEVKESARFSGLLLDVDPFFH
jgi:hypothetical protein